MNDTEETPGFDQTNSSEGTAQIVAGKLSAFLEANPSSSVTALTDEAALVEKPWGEAATGLVVDPDHDDLIDALNHIVLPERYSAIWHADSHDLEVIFTAFKLAPHVSDLKGRAFSFCFNESVYTCEFTASSGRLELVGESFVRLNQSPTNWRNLSSFASLRADANDEKRAERYDPLSFWIRNIDIYKEDYVLEFIKQLNFFMNYFDTFTPRVLIHDLVEAPKSNLAIRFPHGPFPTEIQGRDIDDNLQQFWEASFTGDPMRRFIYNYQIIEYAAVYFIQDDVRRNIRRLLHSPNAMNKIDFVIDSIVDVLTPTKQNDVDKRTALLRQCVSVDELWNELQHQKAYFEVKQTFDRDYPVDPILVPSQRLVTFASDWPQKLERTLRHIRNGLSHGREVGKLGVIAPTIANQNLIAPWIGPIPLIARQVMLYRAI